MSKTKRKPKFPRRPVPKPTKVHKTKKDKAAQARLMDLFLDEVYHDGGIMSHWDEDLEHFD